MSDNVQQEQEHTEPAHGPDANATTETPNEANEQDNPTTEPSAGDWEAESRRLTAELETATKEHDKLAALYSRLRADFDNFRRRKEQETEVLKTTAASDFVKRLLPTVDNLERAVASAGEGEGPLAEGVRLVLRQFMQVLDDYGVQPIASVGQPFDPTYHEAVDRVEDSDAEAGTIVDELQKGYRMGDMVLRPSMVRVAG